jgi:exodeoxyribonuclease V alpha subunit
VHKSQGSEYPAVIVPVHTQHYVMLQRNLLYTAVTRGKRLVVLVSDPRALRIALTPREPGADADDRGRGRDTKLAVRVRAVTCSDGVGE